ncbi:MAG: hypothetical protein AAFO91_18255, partial [Bacteroidota bacterium]
DGAKTVITLVSLFLHVFTDQNCRKELTVTRSGVPMVQIHFIMGTGRNPTIRVTFCHIRSPPNKNNKKFLCCNILYCKLQKVKIS